jgi:hypothetical protein
MYYGEHNANHSNLDRGPDMRKKVSSEVNKRMKSGKGLCERLCDILANKVTVKRLKEEDRRRKK